ncbi:unnamed protein product [Closterium sp. Naga37s-1]|nr:unnamed protein product [Closterium sp. Naga37s-1]
MAQNARGGPDQRGWDARLFLHFTSSALSSAFVYCCWLLCPLHGLIAFRGGLTLCGLVQYRGRGGSIAARALLFQGEAAEGGGAWTGGSGID